MSKASREREKVRAEKFGRQMKVMVDFANLDLSMGQKCFNAMSNYLYPSYEKMKDFMPSEPPKGWRPTDQFFDHLTTWFREMINAFNVPAQEFAADLKPIYQMQLIAMEFYARHKGYTLDGEGAEKVLNDFNLRLPLSEDTVIALV